MEEESIETVRPLNASDMPGVKAVIDGCGLFPSELLDEMAAPFLDGGTEEFWLTIHEGGPVGVAYCAPERMTSGTWNLLLIAVRPDKQGKGVGARAMAHVESLLAERDGRVLLVETSGLPAFERTRAFYAKLGYDEEARIREFYDVGEDKVVFRKALAPA